MNLFEPDQLPPMPSPAKQALASLSCGCCSHLLKPPDTGVPEGAASTVAPINALWDPGQTIVVEFMGGTRDWHVFCMIAAHQMPVNLSLCFLQYESVPEEWFERYPSFKSNLRISFEPNGRSYSYQGKMSNFVPQDTPTMNLGWFGEFFDMGPGRGWDECYRVFMHELLHGQCGMVHGHNNPDRPFDMSSKGRADLHAMGWTDENIYYTYEQRLDPATHRYIPFSDNTLSAYYWPWDWATDERGIPFNEKLGQSDAMALAEWYGPLPPEKQKHQSVLMPVVFT